MLCLIFDFTVLYCIVQKQTDQFVASMPGQGRNLIQLDDSLLFHTNGEYLVSVFALRTLRFDNQFIALHIATSI